MLAPRPPLGQRIHFTLVHNGRDAALALAREAGQPDLFDRVSAVASEAPSPSFLHSALCAMSLPVRRPADEHAPIIRQDGQYTLVINPKPIVDGRGGQQSLRSLGVPYGSLPRLVLIHIMTEAVRTRSRHIKLGETFTDWMRRMGFRTISYGPRGSATLIKDQLDRLLACEWMIRWDHATDQGDHEFGIKEIKLTNEYVGVDRRNGGFLREIIMTEPFFEHLQQHAVPLNETAIRQIRDSATALDLYTWLAYRLPRLNPKRPATLSWQQLAVHFGNDGRHIRKFRQTVRDAWERQVSAVYPEARADFDTTVVRLHASPPPLQQKSVQGARLRVVTDDTRTPETPADIAGGAADLGVRFMAALADVIGTVAARPWLKDATLQDVEGAWVLITATRFTADWIRAHFDQALRQAAQTVGLTAPPLVRARNPPAPPR
jgi:Plasmid encoded RepA protein/DnaA N-terminal domain